MGLRPIPRYGAALVAVQSSGATGDAPAERAEETIVMWHDLSASDAQVWEQFCVNFNEAKCRNRDHARLPADSWRGDAHQSHGSIATGEPPDTAFRTMNDVARWHDAGALVPLDDLMETVGLDLDDFLRQYIE